MGAFPQVTVPFVIPFTDEQKERLSELLPPYRVILHNDEHNSMHHVVNSLIKCVPILSDEEANQCMMTAHEHGQATVVEVPKEPAEHYRDSLESCGLTATMEPAEK